MDDGVLALALILRLLGHAADPDELRHRFLPDGRRLDRVAMLRALKRLGFRARAVRARGKALTGVPLPALAARRDRRWVVVAKVSADRVLVHDPVAGGPAVLARPAFDAASSGLVVLVTSRVSAPAPAGRFGLGWFLPSLAKHRRVLGEAVAASFVLQLLGLVSPLVFQVVIDKVLVHRGLTTLDVLVAALAGVAVLDAVLGGVRAYLFAHTATRIDVELGARLFQHVVALPLAYFESRRVGDTVARVRELETVRAFLTGSALGMVVDLVFAVVFVALMLTYSAALTGVVLLAVPAYVALACVVRPVLRRRLEEKFSLGADSQAFLVETVAGIETVKAMAVEPRMERRWEDLLAAYVGAAFRAVTLATGATQVVGLLNRLTTTAVLWLGARFAIEGGLTVGELVAFNMLAGRVSAPVLRLAQLAQDFQQVRIAVERLGDILDAPAEPGAAGGRSALPAVQGRITLEHVTFRYRPDGAVVLDDVSLDLPAGQVVGVVGPSGSGKSTLAKLLQRLYVPERGRVLVDGVDLALVDAASLRRQIGVVLQESVLFNRTVRENIAIADPGMDLARVVAVARLAGAHDFVLALPHGYDTVVGERGATLSGGQRQRLAIARALAGDPRILIFDEATSALDYESERAIHENMRAICRGRTVLVIAHRLAAVRGADRIITIEGGRLVEDGTHADLLRRGGRYARLHRLQAGLR